MLHRGISYSCIGGNWKQFIKTMTIHRRDTKNIDKFLIVTALALFALFLIFRGDWLRGGIGAKKTTLVFTQWWETELEERTLQALVREFEESHPGIQVRLDTRSYAEVRELLARLGDDGRPAGSKVKKPAEQAARQPDVIGLDPLWLGSLIRTGLLENLDSLAPEDGGADQIWPVLLEGAYENRALPLVSFMEVLFYNAGLLQAAGFDRPPKSRGDFLSSVRALKEAGVSGFAMALDDASPLAVYREIFPWIRSSGMMGTGADSLDFSAQAVSSTLDFLSELHWEGLLSPDVFSKTREEKIEDFINRRTAMISASLPDIHLIRRRMGDEAFGITIVPPSQDYPGKTGLDLSGWYIGINRQSSNKEAAWAFLSFLMEKAPVIAAAAHTIPVNTVDYVEEDPFYAKAYDIYAAAEAGSALTGITESEGLALIIHEELRNLFVHIKTSKEAARSIQQRWESIERE